MTTKICPKCGKELSAQGFFGHERYCKGALLEEVRFPKQKAMMSPENYAKYLRKAEGK